MNGSEGKNDNKKETNHGEEISLTREADYAKIVCRQCKTDRFLAKEMVLISSSNSLWEQPQELTGFKLKYSLN